MLKFRQGHQISCSPFIDQKKIKHKKKLVNQGEHTQLHLRKQVKMRWQQ